MSSLLPGSQITLSSRTAPTKLVPLSLHMSVGLSQREINHLRAAIKASEVRLETSSRWTALTERKTKTKI